jgi:hypothetical protein
VPAIAVRGITLIPAHMTRRALSGQGGYLSNSGCARPRWDSRASLRARVPPSRASHRAAGGRFAPATVRLPVTAGNLTQIDTPFRAKRSLASGVFSR